MPIAIICFLALIAGAGFGAAFFIPRLPIFWRVGFGFVGAVALIMIALLLWGMTLDISAAYRHEIEAVEIRKEQIKTEQMLALGKMRTDQVAFMDTHDIRIEIRPTVKGLEKVYIAPGMDMSPELVSYVTNYCLDWGKFPELPPQHGNSGREGTEEKNWRDIIKAYTAMAVKMGLARHANSNKAAEWLVDEDEILERLEVTRNV